MRGAEDAAGENGYLLVTFNTDDRIEREKQVLATLRSRRVDGLLLVVAPNPSGAGHIESTIAANIPVVCLDRTPRGVPVDTITVDNVKGAGDLHAPPDPVGAYPRRDDYGLAGVAELARPFAGI